MKFIAAIVACFATSSCVWNVDRPNPFEYERWSTSTSTEPVEIALLECGYPDIFGGASYGFSDSDVVYAERCMRRSGYQKKNSYAYYICTHQSNLKACHDGYAPHREMKRRLNSPYCEKYTKSKFCR